RDFARLVIGDMLPPGIGEIQAADIRLDPDIPIIGTVQDLDGNPIAGAKVTTNRWRNSTARTDDDGEFELRGFRHEREITLSISADGYARADMQIGDSARVKIILARTEMRERAEDQPFVPATGEPIFGRVSRDGQGVPRAWVSLWFAMPELAAPT